MRFVTTIGLPCACLQFALTPWQWRLSSWVSRGWKQRWRYGQNGADHCRTPSCPAKYQLSSVLCYSWLISPFIFHQVGISSHSLRCHQLPHPPPATFYRKKEATNSFWKKKKICFSCVRKMQLLFRKYSLFIVAWNIHTQMPLMTLSSGWHISGNSSF